MEELAIFERIQIYQRDSSCVYDSGENTTSAADILQDLLFGEWRRCLNLEKRGWKIYLIEMVVRTQILK